MAPCCDGCGSAAVPCANTPPALPWLDPLVRQHRARLLRVARHEGLTAQDALDAVQDAFGTFLMRPQARALADQPLATRRLLVTLVRNVARNKRRLHAWALPHDSSPPILEHLADATPGGDDLLARAQDTQRLRACVADLAETQRAVVTLRLLEERPGEDVADLLGVSPNHVAVMLLRAKNNLRACMLDR